MVWEKVRDKLVVVVNVWVLGGWVRVRVKEVGCVVRMVGSL